MYDDIQRNIDFYKGKRVLVTGHTGFKGAWLTVLLNQLGAETLGYALEAESGSLYQQINGNRLIKSVVGNLLDIEMLKRTIKEYQPEIVFHLAAFGFVKECFVDPVKAYQVNVIGTANLLETLKECDSVKSIVVISSDKVYENNGNKQFFSEKDKLGGIDPYSCSKTCMEMVVDSYKKTYFQGDNSMVGIAIARASNVLAGGDHISSRLIPSILGAVDRGEDVKLRHPEQTRPWQSVLDALNGYLTIGRFLFHDAASYSSAWNIGPIGDGVRTVQWVFDEIKDAFDGLSSTTEKEGIEVKEATNLGLDISKSLKELDWRPHLTCVKAIQGVVDFYKRQKMVKIVI